MLHNYVKRKTAFDNVNYFLRLHACIIEREAAEEIRPMDVKGRLQIQASFARMKAIFKIPAAELRSAIYFAFTHNPLKLEDVGEYGNVNTLLQTGGFFNKWKRDNRSVIESVGLHRAVTKTIPRDIETDAFLLGLMGSLLEPAQVRLK